MAHLASAGTSVVVWCLYVIIGRLTGDKHQLKESAMLSVAAASKSISAMRVDFMTSMECVSEDAVHHT